MKRKYLVCKLGLTLMAILAVTTVVGRYLLISQNKIAPGLSVTQSPFFNISFNTTTKWTTFTFPEIGFSFELPPDWILLSSQDPSRAKVELKVVNDDNPQGQYYNVEIISGPALFLGNERRLQGLEIPRDNQRLADSTEFINGSFAYNGLLNEAGYLEGEVNKTDIKYSIIMISGKEVIYAETDYLIEAFISLKQLGGRNLALVLSVEDKRNKEIFNKILSTFEFFE